MKSPGHLRRSVKRRLARYPKALRFYHGVSWAFRRSRAGVAARGFVRNVKAFLAQTLNVAFPMWLRPRCWLAYYYARHDEPEKAVTIADDVLARDPNLRLGDPPLNLLASIYFLQGRYEDAYRLFERVQGRRRKAAATLQFDRLGLRLFTGRIFSPIGHIGRFDKYVKGEILGIIPQRTNVIVGSPEEFSNPAYVRYWQKYFALVSHPKTVSNLTQFSYFLEEQMSLALQSSDGRLRTLFTFDAEVQSRWEAEGRGPLLELSAEHRERGYRLLRELGVPDGAWFVGLHVREGKDQSRALRDSDVTTYRAAIEEIAERGGWVLRMGDRSMRVLPSYSNTIDYAHSPKRKDWMDVFVWAEGRFFIGTGSGPQTIPPTFGKPVAIANFGPIATLVCGKDDILLPKQYRHEAEGRYLTIAERMSPEYGFRESINALSAMGVRVVDNTPHELRDLVIEMIDRLEGRQYYTEEEHAMQARFAEISRGREVYPAKIARAFMSRYPELF